MEWRDAQQYLNETGKMRNFDLIDTGYVRNECSDTYLYPDRCKSARKLVTDISNEKISMANASRPEANEMKRSQYRERAKSEAWREVYPLNNVDFDYAQYMRNVYNPYSLGFDNKPTIPGLRDNVLKLGNYASAILEHPTPSEGAEAGLTDVNPYNEELKEIKKMTGDFPLPYPTFRQDFPEEKYPTTDEHASSYFVQQGWCPTQITSETECRARQYRWSANPTKTTVPQGYEVVASTERTANEMPGETTTETQRQAKIEQTAAGTCFKPRFAYIDNSAKGSMIFKGLVPSMINDLFQFRPDQLIAPFPNRTIDAALPCIEDFRGGRRIARAGSSGDTLSTAVFVIALSALIIWYGLRR
jgi:hypothetical protein